MQLAPVKAGEPDDARVRRLAAVPPPTLIEARGVTRRFGDRTALDGVSLTVAAGEIHALLGPNGAGKTTLLRALTGLVAPDAGAVRVLGADAWEGRRSVRALLGLVPSGDRTFYLRISGLENLVFFARLYGMRRNHARARARELLGEVGLTDAATLPVGAYSHGMQKRLSLARALLLDPSVMLIDEATHDLDPEAAAGVRALVQNLADSGTAVLWTTQRLDEIRGFADRVTLLRAGRVRFAGTVPALIATASSSRFILRLGGPPGPAVSSRLAEAFAGQATLAPVAPFDDGNFLLSLAEGAELGAAVAAIDALGVSVLSCHCERSEIEQAFVALSGSEGEGE